MKRLDNVIFQADRGESVSEEDVRQALNEDIRHCLRSKYNVDIDFRNEVHTNDGTFIDSKYQDFLIEYKAPDVDITDERRKQLVDYLKGLDDYQNSWGIITNGRKIEFYVFSSIKNDFIRLWGSDPTSSTDFSNEKFDYLCELLSKKEKIILTENNINYYYGIENNKEIIKTIYEKLSNSTKIRTNLLYNEWLKLFNLSDEHDKIDETGNITKFYKQLFKLEMDDVESQHKALFSIQTYYAIMLKLILHRIVLGDHVIDSDASIGMRSIFSKLESNEFYRQHNILNLIDGDFFSWYLDEFDEDDFRYFYENTLDIETIKCSKVNSLFIKFYENIFPFWVRHSMGEYYTPDYLAEEVINNTVELIGKPITEVSLLDPCCGSGIFLLKGLEANAGNVYGVDINPLAVLTSKVNYLINNFNTDEELEIPVYLGDSTYFPELTTVNGIECFKYQLTTSIKNCETIDFVFSKDIVNKKNFFLVLDEIEDGIKAKQKK